MLAQAAMNKLLLYVCGALLIWASIASGCAWKRGVDGKADDAIKGQLTSERNTQAQGAKDAAKANDTALDLQELCSSEMERVRGENDQAVLDAQEKQLAAEQELEEYLLGLNRPRDKGDQCAAFLESQVCPELANY